jgi:predicted DNA-binding protein
MTERKEIKHTYAIRFRPSMVKKLDAYCKKQGRDRSNMVEHMINLCLEKRVDDWDWLVEQLKDKANEK